MSLFQQPALIEFSLWLELLALCMEAGLDFTSSLKELLKTHQHTAPLSRVGRLFALFMSQMKLGHTRQQAVAIFQKQWQHPVVDHFCQTLLFGWRQGISISPLLREQAHQIRSEALFQMEKEVQKKQLKLLGPLFLLVLPAVMILLFIPLMVQFIEQPF